MRLQPSFVEPSNLLLALANRTLKIQRTDHKVGRL
jgi:hypothetical protein